MDVTILGSSSSGNCTIVRDGDRALILDAGLAASRIVEGMECLGLSSVEGMLITHEHSDHARGLKNLAKRLAAPVFTTSQTAAALRRSGVEAGWRIFASGSAFELAGFKVQTFSVPHDAADPVGFVIGDAAGARFAAVTDLGFATRQVIEAARGVDALLVEANHDEELLQRDTKRPWSVKQRITSRHGHLSNASAARLVAEVAHAGLRRVVLGHLSRDCNSGDLALRAVNASMPGCCTASVVLAPGEGEPPLGFEL